jgi:Na+-driven multidrug efflux pump
MVTFPVLPQLFLVVGSQVAFQTGDWYIPPASMFFVLTAAGGASYLLAFKADLGAFGIGLGGSIGSLLSAMCLGAWFLGNKYRHYALYTCHINKFSKKMKSLVIAGWKLAAQRLTEWANLLAITTIIGIQSNANLVAINPGILYLGLFSPLQQGFAQATGMIISKHKGKIQEVIQRGDLTTIEKYHKSNIQAVIKSNLFGLLLGSTLAASFYLARQPLTNFFLPNDPTPEIQELAESLLWINMVGLIPDSVRIISAGAFRAWNDLLFPTTVSTVFMSVIGLPCAYGLGKLFNPSKMMIYVRDTTIALSTVVILKRCHSHIKHDAEKLGISNKPSLSTDLNDEHLKEAIVLESQAETSRIEHTQTRPSEYKTAHTTTFAGKWQSFFTKLNDELLKNPFRSRSDSSGTEYTTAPKNQKCCAVM